MSLLREVLAGGGKFEEKLVRRTGRVLERMLIELSDVIDEKLGGSTKADAVVREAAAGGNSVDEHRMRAAAADENIMVRSLCLVFVD